MGFVDKYYGLFLALLVFGGLVAWLFVVTGRRVRSVYDRLEKRFKLERRRNKRRLPGNPLLKYDLVGNHKGRALRIFHEQRVVNAYTNIIYTVVEVLGRNPYRAQFCIVRKNWGRFLTFWKRSKQTGNDAFDRYFLLYCNDEELAKKVFGGEYGDTLIDIFKNNGLRARIDLDGDALTGREQFSSLRRKHNEKIAELVEALYGLRHELDKLS